VPSRFPVALLTREYPPEVYGGAGVHVEYLARELAALVDLTVHCFGAARPAGSLPVVRAHESWESLANGSRHSDALAAMSVDLAMAAAVDGAALVHSHTWYAQLGGHLAKLLHGIPHVTTVHSLEPLRPWKAEQLGGGYALSSFCERTAVEGADAVIAVSGEMRHDVAAAYPSVAPDRIHVIHNGIDTDEYRPDGATGVLEHHGIDPARPAVVFVGRVTRQKGLAHLLAAAPAIDPAAQIVVCAGAADTPELKHEIFELLADVRTGRGSLVLVEGMLPKPSLIQILSHATVLVCPSIYEPLGIVNLEAMACETAVVATRTGGIPEVVEDGVTGLLVPFEVGDPLTREPADPAAFASAIAERVNTLLADPGRARQMGIAGRARAADQFSWASLAADTVSLYRSLL
jgi:alpha-maltose-1-phosphate synthase